MKLINIAISGLALVSALFLGFNEGYMYSGLLFLLSFTIASIEVRNKTTELSLYVIGGIYVSWGFVLDLQAQSLPIFTISSLGMYLGANVRLLYLKKLSYAKYRYLETVLVAVSAMMAFGGGFFYDVNLTVYLQFIVLFMSGMMNAMYIVMSGIQFDKRDVKATYSVLNNKAPYFELTDQNEEKVKLSDFEGKQNLLLIFVRGDWCPYCHMMLRTYMKNRQKFAEKKVMVLAIGPDPVGVNRKMVEKLDLDYRVLFDDKMEIAQKYGIRLPDFEIMMATKHEEGMPLPASFLIDKKGYVRYTSSTEKVGEFLDPTLIFPVLENLN